MGASLLFGILFLSLIVTSFILLMTWVVTRNKIYGKWILFFWSGVLVLYLSVLSISTIFSKKVLDKEDYYGSYIIDRNYFAGKQADWQYNNFRFEILENDSIYFHVTDDLKIVKTYKGTISTLAPYRSKRLVINMESPSHHILNTSPTIYRSVWGFYMVFNSPKFHNMYFRKGKWKEIK